MDDKRRWFSFMMGQSYMQILNLERNRSSLFVFFFLEIVVISVLLNLLNKLFRLVLKCFGTLN